MDKRRLVPLVIGLGAAAIAPACAQGTADRASDLSATSPEDDGGGGATIADCPLPCGAGQACSSGACVAADTDADHDGHPSATDCDDADADVHPTAKEVCDGKDTDCNGKVDDVPASLHGSLVAPIDAHWAFARDAVAGSGDTAGWAQLTPAGKGSAGALWWSASYTFDTFDVAAKFWISQVGADGIAFAWVPGTDVTVTGAAGEGFGINGLGGYAIAIDTYQNANEPPAPFLVVYDGTTGSHLARAALPEVRDAQEHSVRVALDADKVSAWVDGINYVNAFAIPGYTPFAGHWGFTAGTGGEYAAHWVKSITMSFPAGQGCVP